MSTDIYDFFLNSQSAVIQFETLELSHPNFTQTYFLVRNAMEGLTATLESSTEQFFEYCPIKITENESSDNLDYGLRIELGELGEVLPTELDAVQEADGFNTKPIFKYRTFRSDDLSAPMLGPVTLEVTEFSFDKIGAKFEAKVPSLNLNKTGEFYTPHRFPMLKDI